MLKNPQMELRKLRQDLIACMSETLPSKEFGATIMMAMVWLHVIESRIRKTQDIIERRRLINEFDNKRTTIRKGIRLLRQSSGGNKNNAKERLKMAVS